MAMDWENYGRDRYGDGSLSEYHEYSYKTSGSYQGNFYRGSSYVEGNTVRHMSALPERRREERPVREPRRQPERQPVRIPGISGRAFLFLTAMLFMVVGTGFLYLSSKNTVAKQKSEIVSLQSEIALMKEENDETYQSIENSVNLAEIYERATKKLKMIKEKKDQIYTYSNKKSDMVKQYANIPGAD